jgi:hypothetical protein
MRIGRQGVGDQLAYQERQGGFWSDGELTDWSPTRMRL